MVEIDAAAAKHAEKSLEAADVTTEECKQGDSVPRPKSCPKSSAAIKRNLETTPFRPYGVHCTNESDDDGEECRILTTTDGK